MNCKVTIHKAVTRNKYDDNDNYINDTRTGNDEFTLTLTETVTVIIIMMIIMMIMMVIMLKIRFKN